MADVLEILDVNFSVDGTCYVEAVVDDMVLERHQTDLDPPEWGPAVCRGSFYFCDEDVIPATDAGLIRMFEERVDNWELVEPPSWAEFGEGDT